MVRGTITPTACLGNNYSTTDIVRDDLYQSKEFQQREFSNATGLDLYDFHARMYDPVTCRWQVPDPAAQFANPYLAMFDSSYVLPGKTLEMSIPKTCFSGGNDPVLGVNPDGRIVVASMVVLGLAGIYMGGSIANDSYSMIEWDWSAPETYIGLGLGAVGGALGGKKLAMGWKASKAATAKSGTAAAKTGTTKTAYSKFIANSYSGTMNAMYNYDSKQGAWETFAYFGSGFLASYVGINAKGVGSLILGGLINSVTGVATGEVSDGFSLAQHFVGGALAATTGKSFHGVPSIIHFPYFRSQTPWLHHPPGCAFALCF